MTDHASAPARPKSHPRRWVAIVVVIAACLLVAEVTARAVEPLLPPADQWPTDQTSAKADQIAGLAAGGSPIDVVFLGSSVVVQGVDPIAFNDAPSDLTSYNAALDGASPRSVEAWAKDVVFPSLDPQAVVIGITTRDLNDRGVSQQEFYRSLLASSGLQDLEPQSGGNRLFNDIADLSALLRIRPFLRQPGTTLQHVLGQDSEVGLLPGPFGAAPIDENSFAYDSSESWRNFWRTRHFNDFTMGGHELSALQSLIDLAIEQQRRVFLVEMPLHNDYLSVQPNGEVEVERLHNLLANLEYDTGVELIALADRYGPEVFRDPAHLNPDGAAALGAELAAYVADSIQVLNTKTQARIEP